MYYASPVAQPFRSTTSPTADFILPLLTGINGDFSWMKQPRGGTGPNKAAAEQTYDDAMLGTSAVLGIVSGFVGLITLVVMATCKQIAGRVKRRINFFTSFPQVSTVLVPILGGTIIGAVSYAQARNRG